MSVPLPNLDDRRWVDLVEEGRAFIPFYGPGWTDHNIHDPGVTFLELLAWLTEMDVYQVNRVPEQHVRKFLALVGSRPLPPQAARAVVSMSLKAGAPLAVPSGFEFEAIDSSGVSTRFRTMNDLMVVPYSLEAIQSENQAGFQNLTERWRRSEAVPLFGSDPHVGTAWYLGFKSPPDQNVPVTLFVQFESLLKGEEERQRIVSAIDDKAKDCVVPPGLLTCDEEALVCLPHPIPASLQHHSVRTIWEMLDSSNLWRQINSSLVQDETRAFTVSGKIQFLIDRPMGKRVIGQVAQPLHYVRCRIVAGAFDACPLLKDVTLNGALVEQAVSSDHIVAPHPSLPHISFVINQKGDGSPDQRVLCPDVPVLESSAQVWTTANGDATEWKRKADFDASSAADSHYVLDASRGILTFGDGQKGRTVSANETIWVSYLHTRAEAGNVPTDSIRRVASSRTNLAHADFGQLMDRLEHIHNRLPGEGGRAAERFNDALARAFLDRERTPRAVTLADYERMATETPGTKVSRAAAWANVHPAFPCLKAPGVVTVVILPYLPTARPFPSRGLLQAVTKWLRQRRVVTTRVEVVGPTYTDVRIRVRVRARLGVNKRDLVTRVRASVDAFFHPLTGGPDKMGWPFGRDVYRSEVLQILDETSGLDHVLNLEFIDTEGQALCGNVCLGRFGLVAVGKHEIEMV